MHFVKAGCRFGRIDDDIIFDAVPCARNVQIALPILQIADDANGFGNIFVFADMDFVGSWLLAYREACQQSAAADLKAEIDRPSPADGFPSIER